MKVEICLSLRSERRFRNAFKGRQCMSDVTHPPYSPHLLFRFVGHKVFFISASYLTSNNFYQPFSSLLYSFPNAGISFCAFWLDKTLWEAIWKSFTFESLFLLLLPPSFRHCTHPCESTRGRTEKYRKLKASFIKKKFQLKCFCLLTFFMYRISFFFCIGGVCFLYPSWFEKWWRRWKIIYTDGEKVKARLLSIHEEKWYFE